MSWTREQVEQFFKDKFIALTFDHYYKYTFTFTGIYQRWDDKTKQREFYQFICQDGGNHDDIYRFEVNRDEPKPLFPLGQWGYDITIKKSVDRENWETIYYEYMY